MLGRLSRLAPEKSHAAMPRFPTIRTEIAGVGVEDLAQRFGTPVYVYDAAMISQRLADLKRFDVVRFAQKACSNLAIIDLVRRGGAVWSMR
jgi:diaminopimelate decarboxylase